MEGGIPGFDWFTEACRLQKLCELQHNALLRIKADILLPEGDMDASEQLAIEAMNEAIEAYQKGKA